MPSASATPRRARPMNIVLRRGSSAEHKYRSIAGVPDLLPEQLAPGVPPTPAHGSTLSRRQDDPQPHLHKLLRGG